MRREAVGKLTDQAALAQIARNDGPDYVRMEAVCKLTNQELLADIARNDSHESVRWEAIRRLTNQPALAAHAKSIFLSEAAQASSLFQKLTNKALLSDVRKNAKCSCVRSWADWKISQSR